MNDLSPVTIALINWQHVALGVVIFLGTFIFSLSMVSVILVKLPPDYFQPSHSRRILPGKPAWLRWAALIGKNFAGVLLVLLGVLMSIPGVPGQGVLTILLGIMLVEFPGKRRLEQKLLSYPKVLGTINKLRSKYNKPALLID